MPGFFESLKRMAQGQPVFDQNDSNSGWSDQNGKAVQGQSPSLGNPNALPEEQKPTTGVVKGQASTFPVVVVKRTKTTLNGSKQSVYCSIVNQSKGPVELEEIHLMGSSRRLGGALRPGEEREYLCYDGPRQTSEGHREAYLNYKDETGDYFQSYYDVEYNFEQDKTYSVEELHFRSPIRDIYG